MSLTGDKRGREEDDDDDDRTSNKSRCVDDIREKGSSSCPKERKDELVAWDPEWDCPKVLAYLNFETEVKDIIDFFYRAGWVRDMQLIKDRHSTSSKLEEWYIEYHDVFSVSKAIALSGQSINGQPVIVKSFEAEKNLVQSTSTTAAGLTPEAERTLFFENVAPHINKHQLHMMCNIFGAIELVKLFLDNARRCRGFAMVQFACPKVAKAALSLNGANIDGRILKVSALKDHPLMQDAGATIYDLDYDKGIDILNFSLKLRVNSTTLPPMATLPSACLVLKNMFDPKLETEPEIYEVIREAVMKKCSEYGDLKHLFVDNDSEGIVYMKFDSTQAAMNAQRDLHGRTFQQRLVTATFMDPEEYEAKFPQNT